MQPRFRSFTFFYSSIKHLLGISERFAFLLFRVFEYMFNSFVKHLLHYPWIGGISKHFAFADATIRVFEYVSIALEVLLDSS